jgi:hypothetical protein
MLSVDEVAEVLAVGGAGGSYEQTRRELKEGRIIPGLRKIDGTWRVPITALADAMDRIVEVEPTRMPPGTRRPRQAASGAQPSSPQDAYGRRGRRPNALRARVEQYLQANALTWTVLPLHPESSWQSPRPTVEDDRPARAKNDRALQRTGQFWEAIGSRLLACDMEDQLPSAEGRPTRGTRIPHRD